jgi:3-oxoacyl-[acyl-carrier protein] reductase
LADELSGVALVTGGGRGIGARIAQELAAAGMKVAVSSRTLEEIEEVAREIGGMAVVADVSSPGDAEALVDEVERELGPIDLLVNNAGIAGWEVEPAWEAQPEDWWRVFEINVLGPFLLSRAVIPRMIERGHGRIVNTGSGAGYLPGQETTAYGGSKAALYRFGEGLALQLEPHGIAVFTISPGLVRTDMNRHFPDDLPWTPPELAPQLVRVLASGRADKLSGRYLHAEHDDIEDLIRRADEIAENDLNAIRLQR